MSYLRANAERYGIDNETLSRRDVHIHVPAGATPKDGPSAGITIATALASLFTNRPVNHRIGMTGEITLSGNVLPIGGLREKIVAASRYGLETIILPRTNEPDLFFVPDYIKKIVKFVFVDEVDEVIKLALASGKHENSKKPRVPHVTDGKLNHKRHRAKA
jgi:ATP-dependent Lon protease